MWRLKKSYSAFSQRIKAGETPGQSRFNSVEYTCSDGVKLVYDEAYDRMVLYKQNVGNGKVKLHRGLPGASQIRHVVTNRKGSAWYGCLMVDCLDWLPCPPNELPAIGGG